MPPASAQSEHIQLSSLGNEAGVRLFQRMIVTGASLAEARHLAATSEFRDAVKLATRLELAKKQFGGIQNVPQEVHVAAILGEAVFYTDNGDGTFSTNIGVDCSTLTARCQIALNDLRQILADFRMSSIGCGLLQREQFKLTVENLTTYLAR